MSREPQRGIFITLDGPEGGGKSTHIQLLAGRLHAAGRTVVVTREPGGTPLGETLRELLLRDNPAGEPPAPRAEALLFCASRAQLVARVIAPALARGDWVLCDRFADSTLAYQGHGRGFGLPTLKNLNSFATGGLRPDLTLLLDIDAAAARRRLAGRRNGGGNAPKDRFEEENENFHARLRQGFLALAAAEPRRFRVIAADRPVAAVAADIWTAVATRFARRLGRS
jgi:dTMP kinase